MSNLRRRSAVLSGPALLLTAAGCGIRLRPPGESGGAGASGASAPPADDVPRVGVDQAFAEVSAGRAVLVDVRSAEAYRRSRGAGAVLLPLEQIEQSAPNAIRTLPAGKRPILYCT